MMTLTLPHFLVLGAILFAIGVFGIFLNRRNLIVLLMSVELMLLAVNMNFVAFSTWMGDAAGQATRRQRHLRPTREGPTPPTDSRRQ